MLESSLVLLGVIILLLGFNGYLVSSLLKKSRQFQIQIDLEHSRSILLIKEIAENAIEHVKAASLAERENVRALREANNVQINQLRDIVKKQSDMIVEQDTKPEKVVLSDGSEIDPDDYEWNVGL